MRCIEDCIINYKDKLAQFDKYIRQAYDFFEKNEMFFPMEITGKHLEIMVMLFNLNKSAYDISLKKEIVLKDQALEIFELFHDFNQNQINDLKKDLMNEYRLLIGVSPLKSYSVNEYRLIENLSKKTNTLNN